MCALRENNDMHAACRRVQIANFCAKKIVFRRAIEERRHENLERERVRQEKGEFSRDEQPV